MIGFAIAFSIILIIYIYCFMILYSVVQIETSNLKINYNYHINNKDIIDDYLFIIRILMFNKITLLKIKIDKDRIKKLKKSKIVKKVNKIIENNFTNNIKKLFIENKMFLFDKEITKNINVKCSKFKLNLDIGTKEAIITSYIVCFVSSIISILLANTIDKFDKNNYQYLVTPYYIDKNFFKVDLNCIIYTKMVHIINIINSLKRSEKIDDRTSNRRTYDDCYEKYRRYGRCKYNYRGTN